MKVLLVDDDPVLVSLLERSFRARGDEAVSVDTGRAAIREAFAFRPDVVVLDIGLPDLEGWDVLARIRDMSNVAVVLVTAATGRKNIVRGLSSGADDYITKPFDRDELFARVDAAARRAASSDVLTATAVIDSGLLLDGQQLQGPAGAVQLSERELGLLRALQDSRPAPLSRAELVQQVWPSDAPVAAAAVDVAISRLRVKLRLALPDIDPIEAVRGSGYRLTIPIATTKS